MRDSVRRTPRWSQALTRAAARAPLVLTLAALALAAWLLPLSSARAASDDPNTVSIEIANPHPNGAGIAQGPVNANIYAQGQVPAGDNVSVGYAAQSVGCQSGMQQFPNAQLSLSSNGQFTVQVVWPSSASTLDAQYYLCAQDTTTQTIGQSTTQFQVVNSDAPTISVQAVANPGARNTPTVGAGTPTVAPTATAGDGQGYLGGYLQISGQNFSPGGIKILFFLAPQGPFNNNEYSPNNALKVVSGVALSDSNGSFQVIVQLPKGESGNLAIFATSRDGSQGQVLPSQVANADIILTPPPATPTPAPTSTAAPTPTVGHHAPTTHKPKPGIFKTTGVIGLGALSVIFFIVGIAFLVSAASMPKAQV